MYEEISLLFSGFFFLLPPLVLFLKFYFPKLNWPFSLIIVSLVGWLFLFASLFFYQEHIKELISLNKELPSGWDKDGASSVMILLFGWLVSIIYFLPWAGFYYLTLLLLRKK